MPGPDQQYQLPSFNDIFNEMTSFLTMRESWDIVSFVTVSPDHIIVYVNGSIYTHGYRASVYSKILFDIAKTQTPVRGFEEHFIMEPGSTEGFEWPDKLKDIPSDVLKKFGNNIKH